MLALISPAKSLNFQRKLAKSVLPTLPRLQDQAIALIQSLRALTPPEIAALMSISDELAQLNYVRFAQFSEQADCAEARAAALAFDGDVYDGLDAKTFTAVQWRHAQQRLRILSGLYGLLRPLDLIQPYRLEMGSSFQTPAANNLYGFWADRITQYVNEDADALGAKYVLNLASQEYFKSVRVKQLNYPLIECIFEDEKAGHYKVISFFAKRARGLMARFVIENKCTSLRHLKDFAVQGYCFSAQDQDPKTGAVLLKFRRSEQALMALNT